MNRALLEKPFLASEIRQREGGNGKTLDYVEGHTVIARLNEAFEGQWSFVVADHGIDEVNDEVRVLCMLTAGDLVKQQFGSSAITRHKKDNKPVSIADDLKAAATDGLKKCATLFGVGLHLYGEKNSARTQPTPSLDPVPATISSAAPPTGRITSKQHSYLQNLSRELGLNKREVDALCLEHFGVVLDHVTRSEASLLIEEFNSPESNILGKHSEHRNPGGIQ